MAAIKGKHTKPELVVRSLLRRMGYKYRLHRTDLRGKPDIVLSKERLVIFVHGCFWHIHRCRYGRVIPATNTEFWRKKRLGNVQRGRRNVRELRKAGWKIIIVWECWTKQPTTLEKRLRRLLKKIAG